MARLLFVTSRLPFPPREGHQLRSWHLLQAAARAHDVVLLSLRREDDPETLPSDVQRQLAGLEILELPVSRSPREITRMAVHWLGSRRPLLDIRYAARPLKRAFAKLVSECDLVHVDMLALAGLLREVPKRVPTVLNEHNVESDLLRSRLHAESTQWRRGLVRAKLARLAQFEREACGNAGRVLACSDLDAVRLRSLAHGARVAVIPNGVDTAALRPDPDSQPDPDTLLFVGHMGWFPNRDGMEFFNRDIMPRLSGRKRLRVDVIGRCDGHLDKSSFSRNIRFQGFVDDLEARLDHAAAFIVPLRLGSGTRLKVLEAMAKGKAIVSTSKGVEGLGLVDGEHALIADTPAAFAAAVERVLSDPQLRRRLGIAARCMAVIHYDWQTIGNRLLSVYGELLGEAADRDRLPRSTVSTRSHHGRQGHGVA